MSEFPRNLSQPYRGTRLRGNFWQKLVSRAGRLILQSVSPKPVRKSVLGLPWGTQNAESAAQATKTTTATITMATTATVTMATDTAATATTATDTVQGTQKGGLGHGHGPRDVKRKPR
jgi:hypothetical protein